MSKVAKIDFKSLPQEIDSSLPTPLYHQIYLVLKKRIRQGDYPFDTVLPGENDLCNMFGVSRITVKRALSELASEGYVTRHRGRGTVVRFRLSAPIIKGSFDGLLENLLQMGIRTEMQLLHLSEIPASSEVAEALEIEPGQNVQYAVRKRLIEHEPFSYLLTHIPAVIAKQIPKKDIQSTPMLQLLARAGFEIASARQTINAVAADAEIAQALELSVSAPVLRISRVIKDIEHTPVQYINAYYRPDRFEYEMKLTSRDGGFANFTGEQS